MVSESSKNGVITIVGSKALLKYCLVQNPLANPVVTNVSCPVLTKLL